MLYHYTMLILSLYYTIVLHNSELYSNVIMCFIAIGYAWRMEGIWTGVWVSRASMYSISVTATVSVLYVLCVLCWSLLEKMSWLFHLMGFSINTVNLLYSRLVTRYDTGSCSVNCGVFVCDFVIIYFS